MKRRVITVAFALVSALATLAAGGAPISAATPHLPKTPKSCDLLTARGVGRILDLKVKSGKPRKIRRQPGVKSDRCDWESTKKGAGGVPGKALVFTVATFTGADARMYHYGLRDQNAAAGFPYEQVPDLGTDAYYQDKLTTLSVLTSDTRLLVVAIDRRTIDRSKVSLDVQNALVSSAQLVVPRLTS